jgi:uncharacterized protein YndB with AHSA1/START domain
MERTPDRVVEREIELDAGLEEVWAALSDPEELGRWIADDVELDIVPGGSGWMVEDGRVRRVVVDEVVPDHGLTLRWWDEEGGSSTASQVVLTVLPAGGGTRLVVRETALVPAARLAGGSRWDIRVGCLAFLLALARV